ncbi:MAG: DUF86 domain-containing protein [Anaerolineae bacterium]|nr:DUF86 domain-containing protein [Anaerolineae bacterium]
MSEQGRRPVDVDALTAYFAVQSDIIAAYLFGSRATGRAREGSDVDVAVLLEEEDSMARFERRLRLMTEVSDVCGREADVIVLNDAPPILQHQVLKHGRLLYERDRRARIEFEVRAGQIYADLKPMYDFHTRDLIPKKSKRWALVVVDDIIANRLKLLAEYVAELRLYRGQATSFQVYLDNKMLRRAVERSLQVSVEICLYVGRHIIEEGFRYPEDNKDVFQILAEEGVVPQTLLPVLLDMARFRNLMVHDYACIDDAKVYAILKRNLGDFDAYARAIVSYLESLRTEAGDEA